MSDAEEQQRGEREPGAIPEQSEATPEPERAPESRGDAASGTESATGSESESAASESKAEPKAEPETEDERRERWRLAREADDRRRRRNRIAAWCGVGVLVLGGAGWIAEPYVQDRMITSDACDGALPDGSMDTLRGTTGDPEAHLTEAEAETDDDLGRYTCEVENASGERVIEVRVYSRRDDIDRKLVREFEEGGAHPTAALPGGLPGFESRTAGVTLMPRCPGRGKDAAGRPGQLLVDVLAGHLSEPHQLVRAGAAVANRAAEKLGCDTDPLDVPSKDPGDVLDRAVRPAKAAGTTCGALGHVALRGDWSADLRIPNGPAPMTSCVLRPSGSDDDGDPHRQVLGLYALYGDFSQRVMLRQAALGGAAGTGGKRVGPWLTDDDGWAMARCDGRAAGFRLVVSRPDEDTASNSDEQTVGRDQLDRAEMRKLLVSFAEKESAKRGCTGLRLPPGD
ncbi:hypothetical protein [Streptomyces sp. NPDC007063]|uniref:hypothetical protein n=1 Tax=Streptomyces sp. NPDC007063 TaxID=3364772 RepID=UPI0036B60BBA